MSLRLRHGLRRALRVVVAAPTIWLGAPLEAQGVTTAGIGGSVRGPSSASVDGAVVRVVHEATGYVLQRPVRGGVYVIQGLETGGPYMVEVRRIGFQPRRRTGIYLALGERRTIDFALVPVAAGLDTVLVSEGAAGIRTATAGGVGTAISDSTLRRLPTLNADLYDLVRIVPQVGTQFGVSGAGASFRLNSYVIDGMSDRGLQGNGIPGKSISLDAVREYQVLLSPFDARYGDFAGLLVNAVTKSGTNDMHGSAYGYFRNAQLARPGSFLGTSAYERELYGVSAGGPIIQDRVHFFVAPEVQRAVAPARGPYVGQRGDAPATVPAASDVNRFASLLRERGLDAGDGSRVMLANPNVSFFGRLDVAVPELGSRIVARGNYNQMELSQFQRPDNPAQFALTSVAGVTRTIKRTAAVQLLSELAPAVVNELEIGYSSNPITGSSYARMPSVAVTVGATTLSAGPGPGGQGTGSQGRQIEIGDHVMVQAAASHTLALGAHVEFFDYRITGTRNGYGSWAFASLDSLAAGVPSSFSVGRDLGGAAAAVAGAEPSVYASDEWRARDGVVVTFGVRADGLAFSRRPPYDSDVDAEYGRRTSDYPRFRPQISPRVGFEWIVDGERPTTIRGGAGAFVGRPPLGWLVGPMRSYGSGTATVSCRRAVPAFTPYPATPPSTCSDGTGLSNGPVTVIDRNFRMPETVRASLSVDRPLPWHMGGTVELLYSSVRSDVVFDNLKLAGPVGVDPHGRVMFGSFDASGVAQPDTVRPNAFPEAVGVRNGTGGYAWSATAQLDKAWTDHFATRASYTHSRVRDVQSITLNSATTPLDAWAGSRPLSGRADDRSPGISSFEIPHRVVALATYIARWKHRTTDVSLYYVGESGVPFTYGDSSAGRLTGDLNADGTSANDPIYVPRDARVPAEIVFVGSDSLAQGAAFEQFIHDTPCLRRQRGRIVARNSCRNAWVHTSNLSVRQSLPAIGGHSSSVQLDVFNVLNLLDRSWGLLEVRNPWVLQYMGRTAGAPAQPTFRFDATRTRSFENAESSYQLQLSVRYSF